MLCWVKDIQYVIGLLYWIMIMQWYYCQDNWILFKGDNHYQIMHKTFIGLPNCYCLQCINFNKRSRGLHLLEFDHCIISCLHLVNAFLVCGALVYNVITFTSTSIVDIVIVNSVLTKFLYRYNLIPTNSLAQGFILPRSTLKLFALHAPPLI